ncbi:MAG: GMC family oxidoreductase [Acidimicrobiia bacterium]|nr:GMC family oxidoreductase [Acidimicrobiia bacterium]
MLDDANKVPRGTTVRTDVCIVGGGAAGITLARELAGGPHDVVLLESGGFKYAESTQDLYGGSVSGIPYDLDATRLRFFGGSTNHWAGQCRPLDPSDFEARDWVPGSGWPFGRDTLEPYYERAQPMCNLGPFDYDAPSWINRLDGVQTLYPAGDTLDTAVFQIAGGTNFATKYKKQIVKARNVQLITHANVVNVRTDGGRVVGVDARTLEGNEFAVDATVVVLATGGIENARTLLSSRDVSPAGVGNDHDLVGRYFMDHTSVAVGQMVLADRAPDPALYFFVGVDLADAGIPDLANGIRRTLLGAFALTPAAAAANRIPMFSASLNPPVGVVGDTIHDPDITGLIGAVEGRGPTRESKEIVVYGGEVQHATDSFEMLVNMEPTPSPDSRVTLADEQDALGMPRAHLNWAIDPNDWQSMETGVEVMARELGRLGLARLHRSPAERPDVVYGNHHMGTTRMHTDPTLGVVDTDCQVHGVANLYIAGSSVFPAVGFSNPTLTIVALALRMAERIDQVLTT